MVFLFLCFAGERVQNLEDMPQTPSNDEQIKLKLTSGKWVQCDMCIQCTGLSVNTAAFCSTLGKSFQHAPYRTVIRFLRQSTGRLITCNHPCIIRQNNKPMTLIAQVACESNAPMPRKLGANRAFSHTQCPGI